VNATWSSSRLPALSADGKDRAETGGTGGTLSQQARDLIALASQQFDDAQKALQAGDFAGYGLQIEALQKTLRDLQALR